MNVRLMSIDDYDAVYQLWTHTPGMGIVPYDDSKEGIARYLKRNPTSCFVAKTEGGIVGAVLGGHDGRRGFIYHMAVSEAARHQGIGTMLLEHVVAALKNEGIRKVALVALAGNETGNAFWVHHGFNVRTDLIYRNKTLD